jgi:hypothetical protein
LAWNRYELLGKLAAASARWREIQINNAGFCGIVGKWMAAKEAADRECIGQMPRILGLKPVFCLGIMLPDAMRSAVPPCGAGGFCVQSTNNEENAK